MTDLSFSIPPDLASRIESRIAEGEYADAADYVRALIQRDLEEAADTAWVRAKIEEAEASGYSDERPETIIENIIARRRAKSA